MVIYETLERIFKRLEASEVYISRARMDCGSCSEEIVDGGNRRYGRGSLQAFLYSCQQMLCKYPLNAVLHISKKYCTFARRHHFSIFETRIRNLALHQHKLMEVIP